MNILMLDEFWLWWTSKFTNIAKWYLMYPFYMFVKTFFSCSQITTQVTKVLDSKVFIFYVSLQPAWSGCGPITFVAFDSMANMFYANMFLKSCLPLWTPVARTATIVKSLVRRLYVFIQCKPERCFVLAEVALQILLHVLVLCVSANFPYVKAFVITQFAAYSFFSMFSVLMFSYVIFSCWLKSTLATLNNSFVSGYSMLHSLGDEPIWHCVKGETCFVCEFFLLWLCWVLIGCKEISQDFGLVGFDMCSHFNYLESEIHADLESPLRKYLCLPKGDHGTMTEMKILVLLLSLMMSL